MIACWLFLDPYPTGIEEYQLGGIIFNYWRLKDVAYHALIQALSSSARSKLLSAPRVTTRNNQQAIIRLAVPYHYPMNYRLREETFEYVIGSETIEIRRDWIRPTAFEEVDVGITLTVTPNVGADRATISLALVPEIIEVVRVDTTYLDGFWEQTFPTFGVRRIATNVLVEDGETVILGGLIKEIETIRENKVPLLGDIPILGKAFRRNVDTSHKTNLLVFVTAHILTPTGEKHIE